MRSNVVMDCLYSILVFTDFTDFTGGLFIVSLCMCGYQRLFYSEGQARVPSRDDPSLLGSDRFRSFQVLPYRFKLVP